MTFAKCYVSEPVQRQQLQHPHVCLNIFADDVTAGTEGETAEVRSRTASAVRSLIDVVKTELHSSWAEDNIHIIASTDALAASIAKDVGLPAKVITRSAVILGGNFGAGRRRAEWAKTAGRRMRIPKVARRRRRLTTFRRAAGARAHKLARTGFLPAAGHAAEVYGVSDSKLI